MIILLKKKSPDYPPSPPLQVVIFRGAGNSWYGTAPRHSWRLRCVFSCKLVVATAWLIRYCFVVLLCCKWRQLYEIVLMFLLSIDRKSTNYFNYHYRRKHGIEHDIGRPYQDHRTWLHQSTGKICTKRISEIVSFGAIFWFYV